MTSPNSAASEAPALTATTVEAHCESVRAQHVLVAGSDAQARARLALLVWQALPAARVEEFSGYSELVFRVAGSDIDLILLVANASAPWPVGLARLLKGIQPRLKLATVAAAQVTPPLRGADASLTEAALFAWLHDAPGLSPMIPERAPDHAPAPRSTPPMDFEERAENKSIPKVSTPGPPTGADE